MDLPAQRLPATIRPGALSRPSTSSLLLAGSVLLGLALRAYDLGGSSFWGDEIHTLRRSASLRAVAITSRFSPLSLLTRFSLLFGESELWLRLPHAVIGALSIALLYRAAVPYVGTRPAMLAASLLAISPFHIYHCRETRYYAFMVFFSLFSLVCLNRALARNAPRWLLAFAAVSLLNIHNHAFAIIITGALALYALPVWMRLHSRRAAGSLFTRIKGAPFTSAALCTVLILLLYFVCRRPWAFLLRSLLDSSESQGPFDFKLDASFVHNLLSWLGAGPGPPLYVYLSFFVLGLIAARVRHREAFRLLVTIALFTLAMLALLAWIGPSHGFYTRYLIFLLPFYLVAVAMGADFLFSGALALVRRGALGAALGPGGNSLSQESLRRPEAEREGARQGGPTAAYAENTLRRPDAAWRLRSRPKPGWTFGIGSMATGAAFLLAAIALFIPLNCPALARVFRYQGADYRGMVADLAHRARPGDGVAVTACRSAGDTAGMEWYSSRREELRGAVRVVEVSSIDELKPLFKARERVWIMTIEPAGVDAKPVLVEMNDWIRKEAREVRRLPNTIHSLSLSTPQIDNEIVLYAYPPEV